MSPLVPMPSFANPNCPEAASGSVNMAVEDHPVDHSADYGGMFESQDSAPAAVADERDSWKKSDWEQQAESYGLDVPTRATKDDLIAAVEEYEAAQSREEE